MGSATCVDILLAILLPPLGVFLKSGCKVMRIEDSDFSQPDVDMASKEDDMLYDRNVTEGIEIGMNVNVVGQNGAVVLGGVMTTSTQSKTWP